jgi:hypothetical protein
VQQRKLGNGQRRERPSTLEFGIEATSRLGVARAPLITQFFLLNDFLRLSD